MDKKLTTYQRLKKENEEMRRELDMLVNEPDTGFSLLVKAKYRLIRDIEESVMYGNPLIGIVN